MKAPVKSAGSCRAHCLAGCLPCRREPPEAVGSPRRGSKRPEPDRYPQFPKGRRRRHLRSRRLTSPASTGWSSGSSTPASGTRTASSAAWGAAPPLLLGAHPQHPEEQLPGAPGRVRALVVRAMTETAIPQTRAVTAAHSRERELVEFLVLRNLGQWVPRLAWFVVGLSHRFIMPDERRRSALGCSASISAPTARMEARATGPRLLGGVRAGGPSAWLVVARQCAEQHSSRP